MPLEPYQIVKELIAGSLGIVNMYLLYSCAKRALPRLLPVWSRFWSDIGAQGAGALGIMFFGVGTLRLWDWVLYYLQNLNTTYDYPPADYLLWLTRSSWWIVLLGGAAAMLGGLWCVRVFAEEKSLTRLIIVAAISLFTPFAVFVYTHGWPI